MLNKSNILFVGGFFTDQMKRTVSSFSKGSIQNAANLFQWNVINGMQENYNGDIKLLTTPFVGTYPINYKKTVIRSDTSIYNNSEIQQVGFCNVLGIKNYSIFYKLRNAIKQWIASSSKNRIVMFYSVQNYYLEIANWIKKNEPEVHIHIIIPDLPHYMYLEKQNNLLYRIKVKNQIKKCEKYINIFDSYTVLTKQIADTLNINFGKYTIVEGMVNPGECQLESSSINSFGRYCLYTGTLTRAYGVIELIESFNDSSQNDLKLIICGDGETKQEVKTFAENNKQIIYLGLVDKDTISTLQRNALFLINPRKNNDTFARYSFPSKTMEYLSSGRPVLCYKLDGIPEEYDDYLQYFSGSLDSMKNGIIKYSNMSEVELSEIGKKGKDFVDTQKSNSVQAMRILRIIDENKK